MHGIKLTCTVYYVVYLFDVFYTLLKNTSLILRWPALWWEETQQHQVAGHTFPRTAGEKASWTSAHSDRIGKTSRPLRCHGLPDWSTCECRACTRLPARKCHICSAKAVVWYICTDNLYHAAQRRPYSLTIKLCYTTVAFCYLKLLTFSKDSVRIKDVSIKGTKPLSIWKIMVPCKCHWEI